MNCLTSKNATPMKSDTSANFIQGIISFALGLMALIGAILCNAWWHYFTAFFCFLLSYVFYTDDMYGTESVCR